MEPPFCQGYAYTYKEFIMAKKVLDYNKVVKAFPELKGFESDGSTDFERISAVLESRNPNHVWPVFNALTAKAKPAVSAELKRLFD